MEDGSNKKRLADIVGLVIVMILFLSPTVIRAQDRQEACEQLSVQQAVAIAMEKNPGLAAIRARYEAMAAIPSQLSTLPDPVLSLGGLNLPTDTFNLDQENMTHIGWYKTDD